ncbi:hypothetical protein J4439_02085 [Candidatus Woesearchaeota archaeon]|nr:hypothetical protein [Candidatus Woesearchaeota archaeon]
MPKKTDYPHCGLGEALRVAEVVDHAGGTAALGVVAERLKMAEKGGAFTHKVSGAVKFSLIERAGGSLRATPISREIFHPLAEREKLDGLQHAFESVSLFRTLLHRLQKKSPDKAMIRSLLIREYAVGHAMAERVASYFAEGVKEVGLLDSNGLIASREPLEGVQEQRQSVQPAVDNPFDRDANQSGGYLISVRGPGLKVDFAVTEDSDLEDLQSLIAMLRRKVQGTSKSSNAHEIS